MDWTLGLWTGLWTRLSDRIPPHSTTVIARLSGYPNKKMIPGVTLSPCCFNQIASPEEDLHRKARNVVEIYKRSDVKYQGLKDVAKL